MEDDAFYLARGEDAFESTRWTRGPWGPDSQHAGPPAALLVRALERTAEPGMRLVRVTVDILHPIPVTTLTVKSEVVRPGKRVSLLRAGLLADGVEVMRAGAWFMARRDVAVPVACFPPPDRPEDGRALDAFPADYHPNYLEAIEWAFVRGAWLSPGPATAWARSRIPLVAKERPSGAQRLVTVADSASGISTMLDFARWTFINTDLTVALAREPEQEWIRMHARTQLARDGVGVCTSVLGDAAGELGYGSQSLLISPRP